MQSLSNNIIFTSEQAKNFDHYAQEKLAIPSIILMENAGRNVAKHVDQKSILVVCGKGNNGGDGLVAARHLINSGFNVKIFLISKELKDDPLINYYILKKMKASFVDDICEADLIIDAIFGIGLSSEVREPHKRIIEKINSSGKPILSVDVPSGLDVTSGKILGAAVKATKTVTFVAPKTGFYKNDGPSVCGEVSVEDIGITSSSSHLEEGKEPPS